MLFSIVFMADDLCEIRGSVIINTKLTIALFCNDSFLIVTEFGGKLEHLPS